MRALADALIADAPISDEWRQSLHPEKNRMH